MASLPRPEENARKILDIYAHFHSQAGDVLRANNFIAVGATRHYRMQDLQEGLEFAVKEGWIEELPTGGLKLTPQGFGLM